MTYVPLHAHSHYSLLDGLSKGPQMALRCHEIGAASCGLTDHGSVSGVVEFQKAMESSCANCGYQPNQHANGGKGSCSVKGVKCEGYARSGRKAILGCEFYLCRMPATEKVAENRSLSHLCVLAKGEQGWKNLIAASSCSNLPEHFYYKPRLDLDRLASFSKGEWVAFSGHMGSDLANACFPEPKKAYRAKSVEDARSLLHDRDALHKGLRELAGRYRDLFGKENFRIEVQLVDSANLPASVVVAEQMRWLAHDMGISRVATPDAHYPSRKDAADQRILLCSSFDTTLSEAERALAAGEDISLGGFFKSNNYHIPSQEDMARLHESEELAGSLELAEMCISPKLSHPPRLPIFDCPGGVDPNDHLRSLCERGWGKKVEGKVPRNKHDEYRQRLDHEMGVLSKAGLAPYFLIVEDYNRYAREVEKCKPSKGRGSGAGSLVLHLIGVTDCDPIHYDLLFERFYNEGRNSPGHIALPDVDCDFPVTKRDRIVDYIRKKYGKDKVAQMATFSRMQGREMLTAVFRAHGWGTFEERKEITKRLPQEASIADKLQEMREETGEASIIRWTLENEPEELEEFVRLEPDGSLSGPLARFFEQAIRIEGVKKSQGKHAAGVVISPVPLADIYPMLYDKSTDMPVIGYEMGPLEATGGVKFDILGVATLDKVRGWSNTMRSGRVG